MREIDPIPDVHNLTETDSKADLSRPHGDIPQLFRISRRGPSE